jgi:hypothetical protein
MLHSLGTLIVVALFLRNPWSASAHMPSARPAPTPVSVSLFNDAHVPPDVLDAAEVRTTRILHRAGIDITWINCSSSGGGIPPADPESPPTICSAISYPRHLSVRIVALPRAASEDTFGQSFQDESGTGCYSDVYFSRVQLSTARNLLGGAEILGYVMAHEIGHLLLGVNSHSMAGVMRAHWQPDDLRRAAKGDLLFTPEQAALMRSHLAATRGPLSAEAASTSAQDLN